MGDWGSSAFESQWHQWTVKRSLCALAVLTGGVHLPLSLNDTNEQWRDHSVLWQCWLGGSICLWCPYLYICTGISWYFLIEQWRDYSVLLQCWQGGSICLWVSMTPMNSEEITLCSGSVHGGVHLPLVSVSLYMHWYFVYCKILPGVTLTFPYIFLLVDCFKWALIDCIEKQRVHSELWQFRMGGYIIRFTWCHTDISLYLPISWLFQWALIDCIEKQRVHSELWQFRMGGYIIRFTWCHTDISLYLPISWLFQMGSHWLHWKAKSSLWALAVSNGGG